MMYTKSLQNIGDSKAVILDAALRRTYNITDRVEITPLKDGILIKKPSREPREGWEEAFLKMDKKEEADSWPDFFEDEDLDWWEWK